MTYDLSKLLAQYNQLNLHEVIDHDKFNDFAIVHHSTSIEGSTLTEVETRLLLDEGITPKGKPLIHSLMVKDHYDALKFVLDSATAKQPITVEFIHRLLRGAPGDTETRRHADFLYVHVRTIPKTP